MGRCCDSWGERYFYHMSFAVFFWCLDMFGIFVSMVPLLFSAQTAFLDILKTSISIHRNRFIEPRIGQEPHWNSNTSCATDTSERFSLSIWGESTSGKWTGTASCCFKSLIWCLDEFWYHFLVQSSEEFLQPTKISPVTEIWNNVCCEWYPSLVFFSFFFLNILTWAAGVLTQDFEQFIQLQSEVGKLLKTISQNKRNRSCTCQSSILSSIWPCVKRRLVAM